MSWLREQPVKHERARRGDGPTLLECKTYRYYDHVGIRGMGLNYRTDEEVEAWKKKDAINAFEKRLIQLGVMSRKQLDSTSAPSIKISCEAIEFANDSPYPTPDQLLENVYYVKGVKLCQKQKNRNQEFCLMSWQLTKAFVRYSVNKMMPLLQVKTLR
ncbi:MAG: thiamine pyrophosphate-dependent enzyme [Candidatus Azotimanducaceae bacterium WSBS_2022_MAG_OTU7]